MTYTVEDEIALNAMNYTYREKPDIFAAIRLRMPFMSEPTLMRGVELAVVKTEDLMAEAPVYSKGRYSKWAGQIEDAIRSEKRKQRAHLRVVKNDN